MIRWFIALIITLAFAYYQRMTGPTYPLKGSVTLDGQSFHYRLQRSHTSGHDQPVEIAIPDTLITGEVRWRRYPTNETWQAILMERRGGTLCAALPHQPPAGKLEYAVILKKGDVQIRLLGKAAAVTRFKGEVPNSVLLPHIMLMFLAMLMSVRAGLEALRQDSQPRLYVWATTISLFIGGMILGSIVQKYAFGAYWTGFPFGMDLTDNKTLIALISWITATVAVEKNLYIRFWVLAAMVITLAVFAIPHSVFGSELKY
jgi:hypothetical protein